MRSLEEWTKYLEEQEEAALDMIRSRDRGDQPVQETPKPAPSREPQAASMEPIAGARPTDAPTVSEASRKADDPTSIAGDTAVDTESIARLTRLRKQLPEQVLLNDDDQSGEVAQNSYKTFKETREELLQRLLDPQISLEDAARILNVCPTTVRRYTNRGLLKHYRTPGNQRRFRLSDVLALLESQALGGIIAEDE